MSTQPTDTRPAPTGLDAWSPYLREIGYGLLVVGAGVAILTLVLGWRGGWANVPLLAWGVSVSITLGGAAILCVAPEIAPGYGPSDYLRLVLLMVLSVVGFCTAMLGLLLPFIQYREQLGTDLKTWREHSGLLSLCIGAFVGGLVMMFIGLSMGRSYERSRPALRRLLYGYNAVFSSLLVLLILVILNVLAYSPVWPFSYLNGQPIDWTSKRIYSLKPDHKKLVAQIKEPVKVYIILPTRAELSQEVLNLVRNCQDANPRFSYETLSPQTSDEKIKSLRKEYNLPENAVGALVIYGIEPSSKYRFLSVHDLYKSYTDEIGQPVRGEDGSPKMYFTGEIALVKTLRQLAFEDKPVKVYFTQGNGELDFLRVNQKDPTQSMATLKERFDERLFDMAALPFDKEGAAKGIPEDANIVVIAGPRERFAPEALQALRDYLDKKKGKLFVMLGALPNAEGEGIRQTGVEALLRDYGVIVNDDMVLYARFAESFEMQGTIDDPVSLRVRANPDTNNPIANAFKDEQREFRFDLARTIERSPTPTPGRTIDEIVVTIPARGAFTDKSFTTSRVRLAKSVLQDPELYAKMVAKKPLPLAVAVTDAGKPSMVVVGNSYWMSDLIQRRTQLGDNNFELFNSCLAWLVDRPDLIIVIDDKPPEYALSVPEERLNQMLLLPGVLMMIGVATVGAGVWVVRRR